MPFVGGNVAVRQSTDSTWQLLEDVVYQGRKETFTVKRGFTTDFASVPRIFTWLIPKYGRYTQAAVLHDHLCVESHAGRFARHDADGIFRRSMRELGVGFLRRWLMWVAVRFGGGWKAFWRTSVVKACGVLLLGLVALVFFLVPILVVVVWLAAFWVLEWIIFPALKIFTKKKQVNAPAVFAPAPAKPTKRVRRAAD